MTKSQVLHGGLNMGHKPSTDMARSGLSHVSSPCTASSSLPWWVWPCQVGIRPCPLPPTGLGHSPSSCGAGSGLGHVPPPMELCQVKPPTPSKLDQGQSTPLPSPCGLPCLHRVLDWVHWLNPAHRRTW